MKFCFYGSGIFNALNGNPAGGSELQIALIARALSEKGHHVTLIENSGNGTEMHIGDITVLFTAKSNIKGLRFIIQKIPNTLRYLLQTKADFYYIRGFSTIYLIVAFVAWKLNSKLILGLATDIDVLNFKRRFRYVFRTRTSTQNWLKNDLPASFAGAFLLKKADFIFVQHTNQQKALSEKRLKSIIFPNIILPNSIQPKVQCSDYFVYVGSLNERKGLRDLLKTLEYDNKIKIKIIGQPQGTDAIEKTKLFKNYPNVQYFGQMSREAVLAEIQTSKGLLNFSKMEGFPNTFLEAWSFGVSVYSLWVDPGEVIEKFQLGKCFAGDINSMTAFITSIKTKGPSERIIEYVKLNHSFNNAADRLFLSISA